MIISGIHQFNTRYFEIIGGSEDINRLAILPPKFEDTYT